jgi:hypothetical protein
VQGSVWTVSNLTGQYVLSSCPPGYELFNTAGGVFSYAVQQCNLCPIKFYCPGSASSRLPCPEGSFSPSGSSAISACVAVVVVEAVVALPLSEVEFDSSKQRGLVTALAYTCAVREDHVTITSISPSRRLLETSIKVQSLRKEQIILRICLNNPCLQVATEVATKDAASAEAAGNNLKRETFQKEMQNQGLPGGKILSTAIKVVPIRFKRIRHSGLLQVRCLCMASQYVVYSC